MWRNIASNFLTVLVVMLVALGGLVAWGKKQYVDPGPLAQGVCLRVDQGANFTRVSEDLRAKGAISSAYIFRVGASYTEKTGQLKFGSYLIDPSSSMEQIADQITAGGPSTCGTELNYLIGVAGQIMILREVDPVSGGYIDVAKFDPLADQRPDGFEKTVAQPDVRFRVTLVEGATSWRVAEALKSAEFLSGTLKDVPAEGSLAPDSYDLKRGSDRAALIAEMQKRQSVILAAAWEARDPGLPYKTAAEALVMASLIEKETGVPTERRQVASVFINRLEKGMRLQTDPTVIYGVTDGKGVLGRGLRQSELQRRTPYNTYVVTGLPPTPIANPGRASILAAMHPDTTPYLYFVADGSGGHAFAETLDDHNANVVKWRAIEKGQQQQQGVQN